MGIGPVHKRIRSYARDVRDSARFHLRPPAWDDVISAELPFGDPANDVFLERVAIAERYLEFGAGSSTLAAATAGVPLVSVESDPRFLAAVERRCLALQRGRPTSSMTFLHADIGPNGPWGKPILPSIRRPTSWRSYPLRPWEALGSDFRADLVLIDGRFRVACALAVVINQPDSDWTMLIDDFAERPHYTPVSEFATFVGMHGRMAEYRPAPHVDDDALRKAFEHFVAEWR